MDSVNLNAFTENAARLGMRIQETFNEHTRDFSIVRGGASIFDMPDDKVKNIGKQLDSSSDREKLDAMKRLIALISKGRNVSNYFPQVVKNVASQNLEIRKLVYIYLLRYAEHEPDLALLSINTFQKDLTDPNPLIRAMALRVLSGIKVPMIGSIVVLAIKKCAADLSPYVRKAAAFAIPKIYQLDPGQQPALIAVITTLLHDRSPLSIGSAVIAFDSVCPTRLDLLHQQYRRLCKILVDVDEWGQVDLLNLLLRYARTMLPKPVLSQDGESVEELDSDLHLLLSSSEPLFQSRNPAVVLAVVRVFYYAGSPVSINKIVNPLLRILHVSKEAERVVLAYFTVITRVHPQLFSSYYTRILVRTDDSEQVKRDKIKTLLNLCNIDNHQALLREFIDYSEDVDDAVVADAINAIGQCSRLVPTCIQECLSALMMMIKTDVIVSNAVLVLKSLVQNQLLVGFSASTSSRSPLTIISSLARRIDDIKHPQARACVLWLVGQYCVTSTGTVIEGIADWAPDVLRKSAKSFIAESSLVKLQALTLCAKLFLLCPMDRTLGLLSRYIFSLGRYDMNYDVRDRTRMLTSLLAGVSPSINGLEAEEQRGVVLRREQVMKILFEGKAGINDGGTYTGEQAKKLIGSLSLVTSRDMHMDTVLPEWLEAGIDPALRDGEDTGPLLPPPQAISSTQRALGSANVTPIVLTPTSSSAPSRDIKESWRDLDKFYASDSDKNDKNGTASSSEEQSEDGRGSGESEYGDGGEDDEDDDGNGDGDDDDDSGDKESEDGDVENGQDNARLHQ
ncbi:adaptin N terminal region-domain-containing protein [Phlebopus sp. FC_14]|nr:adaptin N terminal region-domain-containing protein [Phlebopus sp. FC_14]